jgi:hypothetical protein
VIDAKFPQAAEQVAALIMQPCIYAQIAFIDS